MDPEKRVNLTLNPPAIAAFSGANSCSALYLFRERFSKQALPKKDTAAIRAKMVFNSLITSCLKLKC